MRFAVASALLSVASVAVAQNQTIMVNVGGDNGSPAFTFNPNNLTATEGSVITFAFTGVPGNHTITQSTFAAPCNTMSGGFDSGFIFIPSEPDVVPTWNLTITNGSTPIWFHCKQLAPSPHCNAGMVGAINAPTSGNTFSAFLSAAQSAGTPGQDEGGLVGNGASASSGPGPLTGSVTGFGVPTGASAASAASGTSTGAASSSSSAAASGAVEMTRVPMGGVAAALMAVVGGAVAILA